MNYIDLKTQDLNSVKMHFKNRLFRVSEIDSFKSFTLQK